MKPCEASKACDAVLIPLQLLLDEGQHAPNSHVSTLTFLSHLHQATLVETVTRRGLGDHQLDPAGFLDVRSRHELLDACQKDQYTHGRILSKAIGVLTSSIRRVAYCLLVPLQDAAARCLS